MKKIRIAHLVNDISPAGKEIGILKLLEHINKTKFEIITVVFNRVETYNTLNLDDHHLIPLNNKIGNNPRLPFKLAKIFRHYHFDIVHTHAWGTLVEGSIGAKLSKIPIIIHGEHGTFPTRPIHLLFQRYFWGRADRVLSVSDKLRQQLSEVVGFPKEKINVILNGVDQKKFFLSVELRKKFRNDYNFNGTDFLIGTVGRLKEVKNQTMLIRAMALLRDRGEKLKAVIVGDGDKEEELLKLTDELNLSDHVLFTGFISDVNQVYNGFDLFVLTSLSEGCSNVIQEAMMVGKPVIATNVGGNPELVDHGHN